MCENESGGHQPVMFLAIIEVWTHETETQIPEEIGHFSAINALKKLGSPSKIIH